MKEFLEEDYLTAGVKFKIAKGSQKKLSMCQKYVMIKPENNKLYILWRFFFFCSILLSFIVIPLQLATKLEYFDEISVLNIELTLDVVWLLNIILCFITSEKLNTVWVNEFSKIAPRYLL